MANPVINLTNQYGENSNNFINAQDYLKLENDVLLFSGATAPVNGTTGDNVAGKGSLYVALDTGIIYQQTGAITSPTWVAVGDNEVAVDQLLTGFVAAAGVVADSDTVLEAFGKLAGNNGSRVQRITVGYAALNSAGSGVALELGSDIPDNAIIRQVYYDVRTTFADNGTAGDTDDSTISLGLNTGIDVVAATAISAGGNVFDAGIHAGIPTGAAANMVKLTAARKLSATWTLAGDVTALTAGAMDVFVEYELGL